MSPSDEIALRPDFQPEPSMTVSSPETLRALSDPTRLRIMEVMVQRQDPPWTVKEIAARLGVPQTRLYHHVDLLLSHGLLVPVERRVVSGILETRYRVAALSVQLDRRLFAGDADAATAAMHDALVTVFDAARDEIETAMREGLIDLATEPEDNPKGVLVTRGLARLSPARAAELRRRLLALQEEFADAGPDGPSEDDAQAWGVVLAVYPIPSTLKEATDG